MSQTYHQFLLLLVIQVVAQTTQDAEVVVIHHHLVVIAVHLVDMVLTVANNMQEVSVEMVLAVL